jgi:competence protein ComEC
MFSWHSIPFARFLITYIIGVFLALYVHQIPITLVWVFFIIGLLFILFVFKNNVLKQQKNKAVIGFSLLFIFILIGFIRTSLYQETKLPQYFGNHKKARFYKVEIKKSVVEKAKFYRSYAEVIQVIDSQGKATQSCGMLLLYLSKNITLHKPRIGNQYLIEAISKEIPSPANPGEFNYKQFLSYQNIHYQSFVYHQAHLLETYTQSIFRYAELLRDEVKSILERSFKNKEVLGVAEALLIGFKDNLDQEVVAAYSRTGTLHVLAVSGLHVGIIYWILGFLTIFLKKVPKGLVIQTILIVLALWLYAFVTGLSSSVMRATLMFSLVGLSKLFNKRSNIFNTIYASALVILVINPLDIVNVSFQLSYAAVLGIVYIQPKINQWYAPYNKIDKFIWGLISVSFAAQLFTFPLGIYYFHQFPNYFLFSNLIIIPLILIIMVLLIALISLSWLSFIADFISWVSEGLISINNFLVKWLDRLPGSHINGLHLDFWQLTLVYLVICLWLLYVSSFKKYVFFCFLGSVLLLISTLSYQNIMHQRQRVLTFHDIKRHDVYTCIEGKRVYVISDSIFLEDKNAIRFHLEPYFWEHGINQMIGCDFSKNHIFTHLKIKKNVGFQFFDKKMTIYKKDILETNSADFLMVKWHKKMNLLDVNKHHKTLFMSNLYYHPATLDSLEYGLGFRDKYYTIKWAQ